MSGFLRTRRAKILAALAIIIGLVLAFPMSVAFSIFGLKDMGVSAKSIRGPVWWAGAEELKIGGFRLGTLDVFLDPLRLFIGQARIDVVRINNRPDDLRGGVTVGPGVRGIDDVTGEVALGNTFAPLPVSRIKLERVSVRFSGGACSSAEGQVRAQVPSLVAGLDLANGFAGTARCDGGALLLPLASQSGQERLDLRVQASGAYEATMRIKTSDPALTGALAANGFQAAGGDYMLRISGTL